MGSTGSGDVPSASDGITFFSRLNDEDADESESQNAGSGVLSSIFSRIWRSDASSSPVNGVKSTASEEAVVISDVANGVPSTESVSIDTDSPPVNGNGVATHSNEAHQNGVNRSSRQDSPGSQSTSRSIDEQSENGRKLSGKLARLFKGGSKQGLQDYNRSNFKQYWMPDSTGRECYQCEEKFTAFRRRHHCRLCGQIFCTKCCNIHVPGAALGYTGDLRLCHYCANMMSHYLPPDASEPRRNLSTDESSNANRYASPTFADLPEGSEQLAVSDSLDMNGASVATISGGSLLWARGAGHQQDRGATPERKNSLSLPPSAYKPPALLSVQDLYNQHNDPNHLTVSDDQRRPSVSSGLCEEDESGPDWFRNMSSSNNLALHGMNKDDSKPSLCVATSSVDQFEPLPIHESETVYFDTDDVDADVTTDQKTPLSPKSSLTLSSPTRKSSLMEDDVDRLFEKRADQMIDYLLRRERIRDNRWKPIVMGLARRLATTVRVDVQNRKDSMDILSYVHIKKLVVDEEMPSAQTIWGVVCSKTVLHSTMSCDIQNASVMIVAGSIEYERIQGRLSSLEPIICQETEFLSKQVDRILSRRPSLLLVEGGVSRVAARLLREAGVTVVVNCKPSVLERVARSTAADILPSSDAQLIQQNIGFCPLFQQLVHKTHDGGQKILLVLGDCPPDRGCSVLLRGPCARELQAVKRVLQLMTSLIYSSQLEKAYLALFNTRLAYQISDCCVCEIRRTNIENQDERSPFEVALSECILGLSPTVDYEPPFLETPAGRTCTLLPYFKQPLYRFGLEEDFDVRERDEQLEVERKLASEKSVFPPSLPRHPYAATPETSGSIASGTGLSSFRALGGKVFRKRIIRRSSRVGKMERSRSLDRVRRDDVLCPFVHQRVAVLFGSFSPKSPNAPYFCVRPWVLNMEFYGENDMTLGEFLVKYCFNKTYKCPSTNCEIPMLDHSRKMVFGRVCVEVTTQLVVSGVGAVSDDAAGSNGAGAATAAATAATASQSNGQILTWHYCEACKCSSAVVSLTNAVWHLSFGKYLDYLANSAFSKGSITSPSAQRQSQCSHCFFHEQTHFFSQSNYVTTFKVTQIRPFDVRFSPVICRVQPQQFSRKALVDGVTRMAALADDIVQTAEDRLQVFTQHDQYTQYVGTFHTVLKQLVEKTISIVRERREYATVLTSSDKLVISSNDMLAIKANETMMLIREAIYQLISTWNDQSAVLGATIRAMKKTDESNAHQQEVPDISIDRIDDPFPSYLHLGIRLQPRVGVVVRDIQDSRGNYKPDIGSIIAYALSSADYADCRRRMRDAAGGEEQPLNLNAPSSPQHEAAQAAEHMEIEYQDSSTSYYVKAYYAERFRLLRKLLFAEGEEAFIRSLSQTTFWTPQGGKSGSFFYRSQDDRFIVKQMSRFEIQSFVKFAPNYFEYVKTAVTENKLTTLCKVHGVYRVGVKSKTTQLKVDILVMEYLFYKHNVKQVWDLKGSLRNRMASTGKTANDVLLDENLMKDLWNNQLYVYPHSKAALNQAISNDSHFLSAQHVMDYSLLVGVDESNGQLILGIVDYMRTYTLDKKLESWVKIVAIPGAHLPTILSPEMYCTRFSEAIDTYFPVVPDQWTGLGSAVSY